jgi:imidazolonepropionase-like amidohydrolase
MARRHRLHLPAALVGLAALLAGCRGGEPEVDLLLRSVAVVDIEAARVQPDQTVRIAAGRIVGIEPSRDSAPAPAAARQLDGRGLYVIPGLWDMHVHALWHPEVAPSFLDTFARFGVTGVRDMGGDLEVLRQVRSAAAATRAAWPRVVAAGAILDGPEPVDPSVSIAASSAAEAVAAVDRLAAAGVDFIKVYTLLPRPAYFAAVERASVLRLPVSGHLPAAVTLAEAVAAGQVSIEHLRDEIEPFCLGWEEARCASLVAELRSAGVYSTPTLAVLEAKGTPGYRQDRPSLRGGTLPEVVEAFWHAAAESQTARPAEYFSRRAAIFRHESALVARLAAGGAPLLAGSDTGNPFIYPGESLHRELELLVAAGVSPRDALLAATLVPARMLGLSDTTGALRVGLEADLVLLEGNPLDDISNTRRIAGVVLRGQLLLID